MTFPFGCLSSHPRANDEQPRYQTRQDVPGNHSFGYLRPDPSRIAAGKDA